jgi:hypothetical protein
MPALLLPHRRMPAGGSLNPEKLAVAVKSCGIEVDTPKVLGQDLAEALWCVPACAAACRCLAWHQRCCRVLMLDCHH